MAVPVEQGKLLYHLTAVENLESIFKHGLASRSKLAMLELSHKDIADCDILKVRQMLHLDACVPFHFLPKNPFSASVIKAHPDTKFCYIMVYRIFAREHGFKIVPSHPLADHQWTKKPVVLLDYDKGIRAIDWQTMNNKDYSKGDYKTTSMAECLSRETVQAKDFHSIAVKNQDTELRVRALATKVFGSKLPFYINVCPYYFPAPGRKKATTQ